jgi:hypothetical protein
MTDYGTIFERCLGSKYRCTDRYIIYVQRHTVTYDLCFYVT